MVVEILRIPEERVAILIGEKGCVKKKIMEELNVNIKVSRDGEVEVSGDSLDVMLALRIIKAIGRGFSDEHALLLLNEDYLFDLIEVSEFAKTHNAEVRLKGRVIGRQGRSRRMIEKLTGTCISVYGKTIGIIGQNEGVVLARRAIIMLLEGAKHGTVYRFLQEKARQSNISFYS